MYVPLNITGKFNYGSRSILPCLPTHSKTSVVLKDFYGSIDVSTRIVNLKTDTFSLYNTNKIALAFNQLPKMLLVYKRVAELKT